MLQAQYDAALVLQARLVAERDRAAAIDCTEILARRNDPTVAGDDRRPGNRNSRARRPRWSGS